MEIKNVSRETFSELNYYSQLILKKNKDVNLISKNTETSINTRHIIDSAQIIDLIDYYYFFNIYLRRILNNNCLIL